jgi:hypothetical protein
MKRFALAAAASVAALTMAHADQAVVVELYTSQGCSSCPPADKVLSALADRTDVIPLALHVDYWDYIGWADTFADPAYTMRQKAYAAAAGSPSIYTPQMVVGGTDHIIGTHPGELADAIRAHTRAGSPVTLRVSRDGGRLHIEASADPALQRSTMVQLVRYRPSASVSIERGENAGRTIDYTNIVASWKSVAEWDGQSPLSVDPAVDGSLPAVVIIQEAGPGRILAAERVR